MDRVGSIDRAVTLRGLLTRQLELEQLRGDVVAALAPLAPFGLSEPVLAYVESSGRVDVDVPLPQRARMLLERYRIELEELDEARRRLVDDELHAMLATLHLYARRDAPSLSRRARRLLHCAVEVGHGLRRLVELDGLLSEPQLAFAASLYDLAEVYEARLRAMIDARWAVAPPAIRLTWEWPGESSYGRTTAAVVVPGFLTAVRDAGSDDLARMLWWLGKQRTAFSYLVGSGGIDKGTLRTRWRYASGTIAAAIGSITGIVARHAWQRAAAARYGLVGARTSWLEQPSVAELEHALAIGDPSFDRELGFPVIAALVAVPVFELAIEPSGSDMQQVGFDLYETLPVPVADASAMVWNAPGRAAIVGLSPPAVGYLMAEGIVPACVDSVASWRDVAATTRVVVGPMPLRAVAANGVVNLRIDEFVAEPRPDVRAYAGEEQPRLFAYRARMVGGAASDGRDHCAQSARSDFVHGREVSGN